MPKSKNARLLYARQYRLKNRDMLNRKGRELYHATLPYQRLRSKKYYQENREAFLKKSHRNYLKNSKIVCERARMWATKNPLKKRLSTLLTAIRARCNRKKHVAYKYYGNMGIKCYVNFKDMLYLWKRDNASQLARPSIDRINNNGPYSISNCRFIELSKNIKRRFYSDKFLSL